MEWQADVIRGIQSFSNPFFDFLFEAVTTAAETLLIVGILLIVYWCFDKDTGIFAIWINMTGQTFSVGLKGILMVPRPFGAPGIRTFHAETATGYSFPSAHTSASANMLYSFAIRYGKRSLWAAAIIFPLIVALSRVYLGCHWPLDVAGGYAIGFLFPLLAFPLYKRFPEKRELLYTMTALVFLPFLLIPGVDKKDLFTCFGCNFGIAIGAYLENKFVKFDNPENNKNRILRALLGFIVVGILYFIPKLILPVSDLITLLRYFLLGISGIFIVPAIFKKLKI